MDESLNSGQINIRNHRAKSQLDWEKVRRIRQRYWGRENLDGDVTQEDLAREFRVSIMTISDIVNYRTWQEVDEFAPGWLAEVVARKRVRRVRITQILISPLIISS
jgi:hypothetical protein